MDNKKILIIANGIIGDDPSPSGGDVRFLMMAKQWAQMGSEINILSSQGCQKLIDDYGLDARLHILPWDSNKSVIRLSFIKRAWQAFFNVPESINGFKGIVYSANDSLFDVFSALRIKIRGGDDVIWSAIIHWMPPFPPWRRKNSSVINSICFYINERLSVFLANIFADKILPVSMGTAQQLYAAGVNKNKVYPVMCGVDYEFIENVVNSSMKNEKIYDAAFMKRIQGVKGAFDLVSIWSGVVKERPEAKLVVIGDEGEDAVMVRKLISEAGIEKNIIFTGFIYEQKRKFEILCSSRVFILPSYEENWAISLGEALCCRLPVIAYNLKELVNIWKGAVSWIELGNTENFSREILHVLEAGNQEDQKISLGLKIVRELDWRVLAKSELEIIADNL